MAKILRLAILVIILSGLYFYRADLKSYVTSTIKANKDTIEVQKLNSIVDKINKIAEQQKLPASRCDNPIEYSIGNVDPRFNISQEEFLDAIKAAENIWESAVGKNLFNYNQQNGLMPVSFVYDYRQETTDKLKEIGIVVNQNKASYENIKLEYNAAKNLYTKLKLEYDQDVLIFNKRNKEYQSQVLYWNSKGGAPEREYKILTQEKILLEAEALRLNNNLSALNQLVSKVNGLANTLNKLAQVLNLNVNNYNTIGNTLGDSFEEGLYRQEGDSKSIEIYEYQNNDQLVRVLAHELGHALGIGHLDDKDAIMHYINLNKSLNLTQADKDALNNICALIY